MKKRYLAAAALGGLLLLLFSGRGDADFTGRSRLHYRQDVAFAACRRLEEEIGIQIFYLPEWTEEDSGLLHHSDFDHLTLDRAYFQAVLGELEKMEAAYRLYPEGFLRELSEKKEGRTTEIVLCPYTYRGYAQYGRYVHDYSGRGVDHIYYTGIGDSQYYSHEMGHMVMTAAALRHGWQDACDAWDRCGGYVSDYARTSRPEDWAETWAYLWHQMEAVTAACEAGPLGDKVRCLTELLAESYAAIEPSRLPWAAVLR